MLPIQIRTPGVPLTWLSDLFSAEYPHRYAELGPHIGRPLVGPPGLGRCLFALHFRYVCCLCNSFRPVPKLAATATYVRWWGESRKISGAPPEWPALAATTRISSASTMRSGTC